MVTQANSLDGVKNWEWDAWSESTADYVTTSATEGAFIAMSHIENESDNSGNGLCWAACGAMLAKYYFGRNYTAYGMYSYVKSAIGGEPEGSEFYEKAMLNIIGLKYSFQLARLRFDQIIAVLESGSPIWYSFRNDNFAHAVIMCGAFRISASYGFIYRDPNVTDGYVINYNDEYPSRTPFGTFYYYAGGMRYDRVYEVFYNFTKI